MTVFQMFKHCSLWEEMILGRLKVKRVFLGQIFGRVGLKMILKDDRPLGKNAPSSSELIIKEKNGDVVLQKKEWINRIKEYEHFNNEGFIHPFVGRMTKQQIGVFVYKHSDDHLRQFGA